MKLFRGLSIVLLVVLAVAVAACTSPAAPLQFRAAPWSDGETTTYDIVNRNGSTAGSATWNWKRTAEGWSQAHSTTLGGQQSGGEVVLSADLLPIRSTRPGAAGPVETTYASDGIQIRPAGAEAKTLSRPVDAVDNEVSLQLHRALPLAAGYSTRYTDIIPATGAAAPVSLAVKGAETVTVPAGTFATWRVEMGFGGGNAHDAWYAQEPPYHLVRYVNRASGASFVLRGGTGLAAAAEPVPAPPVATGPVQINVPLLVTSLAVQYPVMLLLPLLVGWLLQRRYHAGWRVFFLGALTFVLSQVGHIPFNWAIGLIGGGRGVALWPLPAVAVVAGLSAGVFEEGARYLMLRFGLKQARGWGAALQFGAGHGGAESIIFGLLGLLTLVSMVALATANLSAQNLPGNTQGQVQQAAATFWSTPAHMPLLGAWERISAITIHISLSVIVMAAVMRRRLSYLLLAIVLHALVDVWAVWAGTTQVDTVLLESVVFGMALALLAVAFYIRPRLEKPQEEESDDSHAELVEVLS